MHEPQPMQSGGFSISCPHHLSPLRVFLGREADRVKVDVVAGLAKDWCHLGDDLGPRPPFVAGVLAPALSAQAMHHEGHAPAAKHEVCLG